MRRVEGVKKPPRKYRPVHVERDAALNALGLLGKNIQYDHDPALGLRAFDPVTGLYDPDELDPRYLVPRLVDEHSIKTNGSHIPLSGDKSKIAKLVRLETDPAGGEEFRRKLLAKTPKDERPKSKWASRPFPKRGKNGDSQSHNARRL